MKIRCLVIVIFGLGLLLASCSNEPSTWQGNATDCSGCDSLYLGFHFGMSQEAFFDHCRGLNKAGVLKEGNKPNTVAQNLGGFTVGARTLMLPTFGEEGIERFDMRFQYEVLRMFRPDLTPMKLLQDVESYLTDELDIELETRDHPQIGPVLAHRREYRQLFVYPKGEYIWATFLDLRKQSRLE